MPAIQDNETLDRITKLVEQAASGTGIEIVEVQLRGSGKARLLRVYIDKPVGINKPGGVTHGDCELISENLGKLLDEEDVIPDDSYTLEVSSPGAERRLSQARDFERVIGQKIRVSLREPLDAVESGSKSLDGVKALRATKSCEGKLTNVAGDTLELETLPGQLVHIPLANIQKANLKFEW